jgi:hypothetical protein
VYNERLKNTFPREGMKLLEECYNLDFSGLIVEINTEDVYIPTYSPHAKKGLHHIAKFDLHDPEIRQSFFSIIDKNGRYALMNESGPVY